MQLIRFPEINNIIFDLGNVIINLDIDATENAFRQIYGESYASHMSTLEERNVFKLYEKGQIPTSVFLDELSSFSEDITHEMVIDAWNAMLLNIPDNRYPLLLNAKKQYRTFCLSNTNDLHIEFINQQLMSTINEPNLDRYFEKVYLSQEMGMRKPDIEIFEKVISDNHLNPKETLFIDDTAGHLIGAQQVGLKTLHMAPGSSIEQFFK